MVSWIELWWQISQTWRFLRHAYDCGWSLYNDVSDGWSHRRYAVVYAVVQVTPRPTIKPARF